MQIRIGALVAMVMAAGCGDGGPDIDGDWIAQLNSSCGLAAHFDVAAKAYVGQTICQLEGGTYGIELESGDADFSVPGKVSMAPTQASCATSDHSSDTATYSFQGKNLALVTAGVVLIFEPNNGGGNGSVIAQFGCLDMAGFTAHPVQKLWNPTPPSP
jgi:hypothetical protein